MGCYDPIPSTQHNGQLPSPPNYNSFLFCTYKNPSPSPLNSSKPTSQNLSFSAFCFFKKIKERKINILHKRSSQFPKWKHLIQLGLWLLTPSTCKRMPRASRQWCKSWQAKIRWWQWLRKPDDKLVVPETRVFWEIHRSKSFKGCWERCQELMSFILIEMNSTYTYRLYIFYILLDDLCYTYSIICTLLI